MKEDLEKYLKTKRLKLDVEEPEVDMIWEGVKHDLSSKKNGLPQWFWKVAAIFIFVVSASYFIINETGEKQVILVNLSDISEDLGTQEAQLQQLVSLKWNEVQNQLPEESKEFQFLLDELKSLDEVYATYQKDLNSTLNNEPVIRAMLDYYEKKIRILNRLLLEIEKEKYHDETITL